MEPDSIVMGVVMAGLAGTWRVQSMLRGMLRAIGTALPSLSTVLRAP